MALGIRAIGVHLPAASLDAFELGSRVAARPEFIRDKTGFQRLRRAGEGVQCSDLCVEAFRDLAASCEVDIGKIACAVVVTQNPDAGGIPHASALVHAKLGLPPDAACFDVSLGCTGYVHALSIVTGFMRENRLPTGLLFTADPYSRIIDPNDRDTALLFGDASTCTLLTTDPVFVAGRTRYVTASQCAGAIRVDRPGGRLAMDGNQVFRFVARHVPAQIRDCVRDNGLSLDDVDAFLLHQGSRYIIDTLTADLRLPSARVPFNAQDTGNSVSSTLPYLLRSYLTDRSDARTIVMAGFGVGLAAATTVLRRQSS